MVLYLVYIAICFAFLWGITQAFPDFKRSIYLSGWVFCTAVYLFLVLYNPGY